MRRCKQTGSCLYRASAALSIFNSVRNSCWRGKKCMVQDTSRQISVKVCRRADLSADRPAEWKTGWWRDWKKTVKPAHFSRKKIPSGRGSGFFLNPKGFENLGAKIAFEPKLCYACVANARRTVEEQWSYLWHFKGPIPFFFLSIFYFWHSRQPFMMNYGLKLCWPLENSG